MSEKLLLEVIVGLLIAIVSVFAYLAKRHDDKHDEILTRLNELSEQRLSFILDFASKESVKRTHERIDEQQTELLSISSRVSRLEAKVEK